MSKRRFDDANCKCFLRNLPPIFDYLLRVAALALIKIYQFVLSPLKIYLFGAFCRCKFETTCSQYAMTAYMNKNFLKATCMTIKRLMKCQPFHEKIDE